MAFKRNTCTRAGRSRLVIAYLTLLLALPMSAGAQASGGSGETERVLLATPAVIAGEVGETVRIVVQVVDARPHAIRPGSASYPAGIEAIGEPILSARGGTDTRVEFRITATEPGRFVVQPPSLTVGPEELIVPPTLLEIADPERPGTIPFTVRWMPLVDTFYRGQSIPIVLELFNAVEFTYPRGIAIQNPEIGLFEEVTGLGNVEIDFIADRELLRFPVASFVFTPDTTGAVQIPGVQIGGTGGKRRIDPLVLDVRPSPEGILESSAVGDFELSLELDRESALVGDVIQLRMAISGNGNLPVLQFPAVTAEGLVEIDRREEAQIEADAERLLGYAGERVVTIRFEVTGDAGDAALIVGPFAFFDPITQNVGYVAEERFAIEVATEEPKVQRKLDLELLTIEELQLPEWTQFYDRSWLYGAFLLPPVVVILRELFRRRRGAAVVAASLFLLAGAAVFPTLNVERLVRATELITVGEADTAGVLYDLEIQEHPDHAGLRRNRAILALRSGRESLAVYQMRRAVALRPATESLRNELQRIETLYGLEEQPPIPMLPRPDIWLAATFVLWISLWTAAFIRRGAWRSIVLFVVGLTVAASLGTLLVSVAFQERPDATVVSDVVVRRIPDDQARPWLSVPAATSVTVELTYEGFLLIRTRDGVEGWVPETALFFEGRPR